MAADKINQISMSLNAGETIEDVYNNIVKTINNNSNGLQADYISAAFCCYRSVLSLPKGQRYKKLIEGQKWLNKAKKFGDNNFHYLLLKCKFYGFKCSESKNMLKNARRSVKIYKTFIKLEEMEPNNSEVYLIKSILNFHAAGLSYFQKMLATKLFCDAQKLIKQASYTNAILSLKKANTKSIEVNYYLMKCYLKVKDKTSASHYYRKIMKMTANNIYETELMELVEKAKEENKL